jgi:hypothetical protein
MKLRDFLLEVLTKEEFNSLKLKDGISLDDEVPEKDDPHPYWGRYSLFFYNTSYLILNNAGDKKHHFFIENCLLEGKFKSELGRAKTEVEIISILDKQYQITEVTDTPKIIWLNLVESIIEKNNLLHFDKSKTIPVSIWFKKKREQLNLADNKKENSKLTHRHHALIYKYKADVGIIIPNSFNGTEIQKEFGAKRKQAFYSIWDKNGSTYRRPTLNELQIVITCLSEFPIAQNAAINDLNNLN